MIIRKYSELILAYHDLGPGDLFIGQIPGTPQKAAILIDLMARGVQLLPSATAQMLGMSKTTQAFLLEPWMPPHTLAIRRRKALLDALGRYAQNGIECAVTKQEHRHCGHGVRRWNDLEMLYSCISQDDSQYPFVLQPFMKIATDLRVIIVGDYTEAYARNNLHGFRQNLAAGGESRPYSLNQTQVTLCRKIMTRGRMPYAHIDLMITDSGDTYLTEISLNGGIKGARISRSDLEQLKQEQLTALAEAG